MNIGAQSIIENVLVNAPLWAIVLTFIWRLVKRRDTFEEKVVKGFESIDRRLSSMDTNYALIEQRIEWLKLIGHNMEELNKKVEKLKKDCDFAFGRLRQLESSYSACSESSIVLEEFIRQRTHYLLNCITKIQATVYKINPDIASHIEFEKWPQKTKN